VETVAPDLITALLNTRQPPMPHTVKRVEEILAQLQSAGHTTLAASLRTKLIAAQPKKPWWKFGK
jgi:hypothetical protein